MICPRLTNSGVPVLASLILAGCFSGETNPPVAKTTGTITYQGRPVVGATVTFIKEGATRNGAGLTNAEGHFEISTFANNDGALIGDNSVTVVKKTADASTAAPTSAPRTSEEMVKAMQTAHDKRTGELAAGPKKTDELPEKYVTPTTSPLKAIVTADAAKNDFKFDLVD